MTNPALTFWRCTRRPTCKARLRTIDDRVDNRINDHTYIGDRWKVQCARVIEQIHEEASNSRENPETIINNSIAGGQLSAVNCLTVNCPTVN